MANAPQLTVGLGFDLDEASAKKVVKGMEQLGTYLEKAAKDSMRNVEKTFSQKLNSIGNNVQNLGQKMSIGLSVPIGLLAAKILSSTKTFERLEMSLKAIEGSADGAKARLKELEVVAKLPGIGFEQAVQGDVRLRAIGIAAEQSKKILQQFANAIAYTGGTAVQLDLVTYQLGQMSAKGKVLGNDLRPIIEQAPAVGKALKEMFGVVDADSISKILESTGKNSTDFIEMLVTKLAEIPRVEGGFSNAMDNIGNSMNKFFADIGSSIVEDFQLTKFVDSLSEKLENLGKWFKELSPEARKAIAIIGGLAIIIPPIMIAVGGLLSIMGPIGAGLLAITGPVAAVVTVVVGAAGLIIENWDSIKKAFAETDFLDNTISLFSGAFEIISNIFIGFANLFSGNWSALGTNIVNIFKGAINAVTSLFQLMVEFIGNRLAAAYSFFGFDGFAKGIKNVTKGLIDLGDKGKFKLNGLDDAAKKVKETLSKIVKTKPTKPPPYKPDGEGKDKGIKDKGLHGILSGLDKGMFEISKSNPLEDFITKTREKALKALSDSENILKEKAALLGNKITEGLKNGFELSYVSNEEIFAKWMDSVAASMGKQIEDLKPKFIENSKKIFDFITVKLGVNAKSAIDTMVQISSLIKDTLSTAVAGLFQNLFSKDIKFDFKDLLASFMKAMGQIVMSMGTAILLAGGILTGSIWGMSEGTKSIATGVALVALGGALMGGGAALGNKGGKGGTSPSENNQYRGAMGTVNNNSMPKVEFVIQGTTLRGVLNNIDTLHG